VPISKSALQARCGNARAPRDWKGEALKPESIPQQILWLTGESGVGKTTYCTRIVSYAREQGLAVTGLLSHHRSAEDGRVALEVEDLRTSRRRLLAEAVGSAGGPRIGKWRFHSESLDWGTEILRRATPCDLLLIDELGPLELTRNQGWTVALEVLRSGQFRVAVVVVRPALLSVLQERIGTAKWQARVIELNESNRADLNPVKAMLGAET
jgi:nucleoside-triphosphatase THEP1